MKFIRFPTLLVVLLTVLPIVAISLLGQHYAAILQSVIPRDVDFTNFVAMRYVAETVFRVEGRKDSWTPIMMALGLLHEGNRATLYDTLFFGKLIRFQYPPTSLLSFDLLSVVKPLSFRQLNALNFLFYCVNAAASGVAAWLLFQTGTATTTG